jgi:3'(2'), 5'-bisphosphate nucleotidase
MNDHQHSKQQLLEQMIAAAKLAGDEILNVYRNVKNQGLAIQTKADATPVTQADLAANASIIDSLSAIDKSIPILSEESGIPEFTERKQWQRYWLVDPLDGTKEFIEGSDEFTVNIALIEQGCPQLGVVYVPVNGVVYAGADKLGAYSIKEDSKQPISTRSLKSRIDEGLPIELVGSRRHGIEALGDVHQKIESAFGHVNQRSIGSSLKMCLIAEGEADIYPRFGPTSEWDTAAAQAIIEAAGGFIVDSHFQPLRYNQRQSVLNPDFYTIGSDLELWQSTLS